MPLKLWVLVPEKKGYWLFLRPLFIAVIVAAAA